jgi:hypothetical protein
MDLNAIKTEFETAARAGAEKFFQERLGGRDQYACGFAWVNIYPKNKGNTKAGKEERATLRALGFELSYDKSFQYWNPSRMSVQNVDTLEAGARAGAEVLRKYGFEAYAGSRLD